jgi:hypothetical protein
MSDGRPWPHSLGLGPVCKGQDSGHLQNSTNLNLLGDEAHANVRCFVFVLLLTASVFRSGLEFMQLACRRGSLVVA